MHIKQILKKAGMAGLVAFVVALGFFAGLYVNAQKVSVSFSAANSENISAVDMSLFWKAWDVLQSKYIPAGTSTATSTTDQAKVYGAIKGLAESYGDPYTTSLTPKEAKNLTSDLSGSLEGIGAVLGIKDATLTVISVIDNSPAKRGLLQPGDQILKIGDESTDGMDIDVSIGKIRGKKGTTVSLTIAREGVSSSFVVNLVRDTINIPVVETKQYPGGVFVIKVASFTSNLPDLFRDALRQYKNSGYGHLVIDLRNNTGGYLDAAVDMASWFLPAGHTVVTEDFGGKENPLVYRSRGYNLLNGGKIVILVNEYTASASEIFAGALRDYGKALLVGEKTYGKGSVQELVPLSDDTLLKITIAHWLTPAGVSISKNGLIPDQAVGLNADDIKAGKDPQLDKALELARKL